MAEAGRRLGRRLGQAEERPRAGRRLGPPRRREADPPRKGNCRMHFEGEGVDPPPTLRPLPAVPPTHKSPPTYAYFTKMMKCKYFVNLGAAYLESHRKVFTLFVLIRKTKLS